MKKYNVIISDTAINNLEKIYNYIAFELQSLDTALKQFNRIVESIYKLEIFPEKYVIDETIFTKLKNTRRMNVDNYAVFFIVEKNDVIVINVLYGAMNLK